MVSSENDTFGIGTNERKIQEGIDWTGQPYEEPVEEPMTIVEVQPENTEDIRFEMPIPENITVVKDFSNELTPELVQHTLTEATDPPVSEKPLGKVTGPESVETISIELPKVEKTEKTKKPTGPKLNMPKVYTVSNGDTLATIAKKFYGTVEGNKIANNIKIYEANRKILSSPHDLKIGQKLVIPSLESAKPKKQKPETTFAGSFFEEVKSIGRKLLPSDNKPNPKPQQKAKESREYVVKDGDYLWKVAKNQLGNPTRYKEIVKLNPSVLKDENTRLKIGTTLNLPAQ
jgi:nucleoid-associated protein YgaU